MRNSYASKALAAWVVSAVLSCASLGDQVSAKQGEKDPTEFSGSTGFYIADNVFIGRDDPRRVLGWASPGLYGAHPINSYFAIKVYGSGHTIAHNAAAFFHDGIAISTHGVPDPERKDWAVAIDIYNNDIFVTGDDFIEADWADSHETVVERGKVAVTRSGRYATSVCKRSRARGEDHDRGE